MKTEEKECFSTHLAFPLIALLPVQITLHQAGFFLKKTESGDSFENDALKQRDDKFTQEFLDFIPLLWPAQLKEDSIKKPNFTIELKYFLLSSELYRKYCSNDEFSNIDLQILKEGNSSKVVSKFNDTNFNIPHWNDERTHYCGTFPSSLRTYITPKDLLEHQRLWMIKLFKHEPELNFLSGAVVRALHRLFMVRDSGRKKFGPELTEKEFKIDGNYKPSLNDQHAARYIDSSLELIEEICKTLDTRVAPGRLQEIIDRGQLAAQKGFEISETLNDEQNAIFLPLLANIIAFFESADNVFHRLQGWTEKDQRSQDLLQQLINMLLDLPSSREYDQFINRHQRSFQLANKNPSYFYGPQLWEFSVLGPRVLARLLIVTINDAIDRYDYSQASNMLMRFTKGNEAILEQTAAIKKYEDRKLEDPGTLFGRLFQRIRLGMTSAKTHAQKRIDNFLQFKNWPGCNILTSGYGMCMLLVPVLTLLVAGVFGIQVQPPEIMGLILVQGILLGVLLIPSAGPGEQLPQREITRLYWNMIMPHHTLYLAAGALVLLLNEYDYKLWKLILSELDILHQASVFLLLLAGCIFGAHLAVHDGQKRKWGATAALFSQLCWVAMYPAWFVWWIGSAPVGIAGGYYGDDPLALLFLVLTSMFFALVVSNIAELARKMR